MEAKHIFALFGPANAGKSTTLKKVFELMRSAYSAAPIRTINDGVDITVIMEIAGVLIGIESQGDPNSRLADSLKLFRDAKCSIIICATRTRGGTVTAVESLEPEFKVVWRRKNQEFKAHLREQKNSSIANEILKEVQNALKA